MKFLDLFSPIQKGDFGLTEEYVYKSIQLDGEMIPLWGGNQSHTIADKFVNTKAKTKSSQSITIFQGEGVIISLDGSAGSMTYKVNEMFALNHHAGFFKIKQGLKEIINLRFFSIFYSEELKRASVSDGSKTLSLELIYSMDFSIPTFPIQNKIMGTLNPLRKNMERINLLQERFKSLQIKTLEYNYKKYQKKDVPVSDLFNYIGGNSGLIEEVVYQQILLEKERFRILSGATDEDNEIGYVPKFYLNGKPIKTFENEEGILVVRKGKAGYTSYLAKDNYTLTDDAYILYLKPDCPYEISIKWIKYQYANIFFDYSSSSDNGTWNMTGFFNSARIDIPILKEQLEVLKKYEEINLAKSKINAFNQKVKKIFSKVLTEG